MAQTPALDALIGDMHQLDPNRHMATTSTWATFPASQFWGNSAYPDIDYADLHAYVSTGLGSYEWSAPSGMTVDTNPADTYNASQGALQITAGVTSGNTTVWVRGLGTWTISALVRAQNLNGSCPYGAPSSMAGPQIIATLDNSTTIAIPADPANPTQFWICTAPAGTYNYTPVSGTLVLHDTNWHQFVLFFKTSYATSGTAWYDNLSIQSPDGRTARLMGNGTFDDRLRMDYDTAWFTTVFSLLDGANSVGGAGKPVIRGDTGIAYSGGPQQELPQLANDTHGVWLHNLEWGTLNPGGMYDLYWWLDDIQKNNLYFQYKSVHDFLTGISLNNGRYQDAQAQVSAGNVRALGQKDLLDGQAHVWIQNTNHTWYNVVNGVSWGTLSGTVTLSGCAAKQTYSLTWWQFDDPGNLTTQQTSLTSDASGNLVLNLATLPTTITDAAVKISGPGTILPYTEQLTPIVK